MSYKKYFERKGEDIGKQYFIYGCDKKIVKPIAEKYKVVAIYLFGSYARGEAGNDSDLDFLVYGGEHFKLTMIFALAEELREALGKDADVFEIHEVNQNSSFYQNIMKERVIVA